MNKLLLFILPLSLLDLSGCSSKDFYEDHNRDIFSCNNQPVQYRESCLEKVRKAPSYEDYLRQRKELEK